jgi:hypothetical protein
MHGALESVAKATVGAIDDRGQFDPATLRRFPVAVDAPPE